MIEDIAVGNLVKGTYPVEQATGQVWRTLPKTVSGTCAR